MVTTAPCNSSDPGQVFSLAVGAPTTITHAASGLCVDGSGARFSPCAIPSNAGLPFCDASLSLEARVADLVGRIQLEEKYGLFNTASSGVPSLSIYA